MARRPAAKGRRKKRERTRAKRGLSALAAVSLVLVASVGAVIGWLALTFDRESFQRDRLGGDVVVALPPPQPEPETAPEPPAAEAESAAAEPKTLVVTVTPPPPVQPAAPPAAAEPELPVVTVAPSPPVQPAAPSPEPVPEPTPPPAAAPATEPAAKAPPPPPQVAALPPPSTAPPPAPPPAAPAPAPAPQASAPLTLAAVPDPALIVETPVGPLPVIAPDGRQAWQVYQRPFTDRTGGARIAIVIADMGMSQSATHAAIQQLPGAVTLAFAPYASDLDTWIAKARAAGHEVILQLPMEPIDYPINDPGPYTLLTSLPAEDNLDRLEWLLSRFTGYVGVTDYMGARFTSSPDHLRPILGVLRDRGLMFLDSRSSGNSIAGKLATEIGLPRALNNRFLDSVASRHAIDARLGELERIAATTGFAIGIGFPFPVTIERIAAWSATLRAKKLVLSPVSALVDQQPG